MDLVNFKQLVLTHKPSEYLACPANYCNQPPNQIVMNYPINVAALELAWQKMVAVEPRVRLVQSDPSAHHFQYVQYSRIFRFPDYIDVQFISIKPEVATLAIYSRVRFGYYDFGVNEQRVKRWLDQLPNYFIYA